MLRPDLACGSEKEIDRIAIAINGAVQVLPLACNLDVRLVHPPAASNRSFASPNDSGQNRQHLDRPAMHRDVIHENTALLHHLLKVAQAQGIGHVPAHAGQHHPKRVVKPFENIAQPAVDQTVAEIKHGRDCRLCLTQQNRVDGQRQVSIDCRP